MMLALPNTLYGIYISGAYHTIDHLIAGKELPIGPKHKRCYFNTHTQRAGGQSLHFQLK